MIEVEAFSEFLKDKVPQRLMRYIPLGSETSLLGVNLLIERAMKKHNARIFAIGQLFLLLHMFHLTFNYFHLKI